jgi:hypothetical protein
MKWITSIALSLALALSLGVAQAQTNSKQATDAASKHRTQQVAEKSPHQKSSAKSNTQSTSKPARSGSVANQLAACKNNASWNVIKREQCVWSLCKGRWGREGCPPEAKATAPKIVNAD